MFGTHHQPSRLVVMISGRGTNLRAIIDAIERDELNAAIVAVVSDRKKASGLEHAERAGIDTRILAPRDYADRPAWEGNLLRAVDACRPDLIVLAGFMRILDDNFVNQFSGRLVNIHPSLLPDLRGLDTHRRALSTRLEYHGASVHFVTPDLDAGPVILKARVPVHAEDDETKLAARVRAAEHVIYPRAIRWITTSRVELCENRVYLDGAPLVAPPVFDFE
jgi:phosphoribosylglycinamide formyltransferase-1